MMLMCFAGSVSAAPPSRAAAFEALQANDQRVMDVSYRLSTRGVLLCGEGIAPQYGLRVHVITQYPKRDWAVLREELGLGVTPTVLSLAADGPAAKAGISVGQAIPRIDGVWMGSREGEVYEAVARVDAALSRDYVSIGSLEGSVHNPGIIHVIGTPGCASTVELTPSDKLNAKADGRIVQITTGVLAEARDDSELAFVIAHEMAHNILRHAEKPGPKRIEEDEADRLGLRLMHAAGYDPKAAARFWTRFGSKTGFGIFSDGSHRRTKSRVAFLAQEAVTLTQ